MVLVRKAVIFRIANAFAKPGDFVALALHLNRERPALWPNRKCSTKKPHQGVPLGKRPKAHKGGALMNALIARQRQIRQEAANENRQPREHFCKACV